MRFRSCSPSRPRPTALRPSMALANSVSRRAIDSKEWPTALRGWARRWSNGTTASVFEGRRHCGVQRFSRTVTTGSSWRSPLPPWSHPHRPGSKAQTLSPCHTPNSSATCGRLSMSARSVLLFGDPVSRSLSPAMQNAAFAACGIDCEYVLRELHRDALAPAVEELRRDVQVLGANVTIPHKEAIVPLLDELDPLAARIGAVNTVSRHGTRLKGWNSDVQGFRRALDECGYVVEGKAVAILGAGGAARAVAAAIDSRVDRLWVIARNPEQAARLCRDLCLERAEPASMGQTGEPTADADLVVNATPADLPETWRIKPD